jgi:hypothetical protein
VHVVLLGLQARRAARRAVALEPAGAITARTGFFADKSHGRSPQLWIAEHLSSGLQALARRRVNGRAGAF